MPRRLLALLLVLTLLALIPALPSTPGRTQAHPRHLPLLVTHPPSPSGVSQPVTPPAPLTGRWVQEDDPTHQIGIIQKGTKLTLTIVASPFAYRLGQIYRGSFTGNEAVLTAGLRTVDDIDPAVPLEVRQQLLAQGYQQKVALSQLDDGRIRLVQLGLITWDASNRITAIDESYRGIEAIYGRACGPVAFPQGDISFADAVVNYAPVVTPDGLPGEDLRDPQHALGPPNVDPSANSFPGQVVTLGNGGQLTLQFLDNALIADGSSAPDLWIAEPAGTAEDTVVEVSVDGSTWVPVGTVAGGTCGVDLDAVGMGPGTGFTYVRLTDDPTTGDPPDPDTNPAPGVDIDAVGAISTGPIVTPPETPVPLTPSSADAAAQATMTAQATRIAELEGPTSTPDAAQATIAAQETRIAQLEGTLTPPPITPTETPIPPTATPLPTSTPDPAQATIAAQAARIATLEAQPGVTPTIPPQPEAAHIVLHADPTQLRVGEEVRVRAELTGLGLPIFYVGVHDAGMDLPAARVTIDATGQVQRRDGSSQVLEVVDARGEASGFAATLEVVLRAVGPGETEVTVGATGEGCLDDGACAWGSASSDPLPIVVSEQSADAATPTGAEPATQTPLPADRLGSVWEVREIGGGWTGVWTRRGTSAVFDAVWTSVAGTELTGVLTITIDGDQVAVQRPEFGANGACDYVGTLADDGRTARGTFSCTEAPGPFDWEATITGLSPESATPASQAGQTPTATPGAGNFITPDPAECTVTPRTTEELATLAASPDQAATDALAAASLDPSLIIPDGTPADAATTAAVAETYHQMLACFNAGNDLAAYALWTDEALRQIQVQAPTGPPAPLPDGTRSAVRVTDVRMLPNGQVVAVWEQRDPAFTATLVQRLVQQDGRYRVAETVDVLLGADSGAPAADSSDDALPTDSDDALTSDSGDVLVPQPATPAPLTVPAPSTVLPDGFVGHWAGTATWETAPLPVTMDLTAGRIGEVVGTIAYALYGTDGPTCGGEVSLQRVAADGQQIELVGTITEDPAVCLVDATVTVSLQADGTFSYDWRHPFFDVSGSGTLQPMSPTTNVTLPT